MKAQTILKPCTIPNSFHQQTAMRMVLAGSKFAGLALALGFLTLLTVVSAWGQACVPNVCPNPVTNHTVCTSPVGGGNLCPSVMYRSNTDLTGAPESDVLNRCALINGCLNTLLINQTPTCNTCSANVPIAASPTSSPSVITRTIFGAQVTEGVSGSVAGLWSYGVSGGSFGWDTIDANPNLTLGGPIRSSPGYPAQNLSPYIFATSETDGALYAFGYTDGVLGWPPYPANDEIDSSPIVTNANEVYIIDFSGYIHKVDGYSGTLLWNAPINSGIYPTGYTPASSISVSNLPCNGQHTALFVAGNDTYQSSSGDGRLNAYDTVLATPCWSQPFKVPGFPFTSSPVVNESLSNPLVYVQAEPQYDGSWSGSLVYARHSDTGARAWEALPSTPLLPHSPCVNGSDYYYSGGSPAYDATPATNYVIAAANVTL
jgi:hypothetical protein